MPVPTYDLVIDQGDDEIIDLVLKKADGTPLDVSGATLWFFIKTSPTDLDSAALLSKSSTNGITVTDGLGGIANVAIAHVDTSAFTVSQTGKKLPWSLQAKDGSGKITTLARGHITINQDLIRATA